MTRYCKHPVIHDEFHDREIWRLREVCRFTTLHRDTVLRAVERGELEGFQLMPGHRGSPWLFERETVEDWWNRKRLRIAG